MPGHEDFANLIPDVVGRFGLWPLGEPIPVTSGTLNWNFAVETDGGRKFVRRYRDDLLLDRIRGEHALVVWLAERGVPVPVPAQTPADESIIQMVGRWAVFDWVEGEVLPRGSLTPSQARTLGMAHGRIQSLLAGHPLSAGATMQMHWDKAESLALLQQVRTVAPRSGAETWVLGALAKQQALLEAMDVAPPKSFQSLPAQVLHGDFHDHQVLWEGDAIAAVADWELWHTDPRVWEVIRSLSFSQLLDTPLLEEYLAGYREHVSLSEGECRLGLRLWWQSRVVGLWAWSAYFLQGNTRVAKFLPAMAEELGRVADEAWKARIEERFVRAATG